VASTPGDVPQLVNGSFRNPVSDVFFLNSRGHFSTASGASATLHSTFAKENGALVGRRPALSEEEASELQVTSEPAASTMHA
jgi:hypothetical protein